MLAGELHRSLAESSATGISQLPQHIVHHILSFLSLEESTRTSLLSKSWLNAWQTRPKLEFNPHLHFSKKLSESSSTEEFKQSRYWCWSEEKKAQKYGEYFEHVKRTLEPYSKLGIRIDTVILRLERIVDSQWNPLVEKCTTVAVENGVRNIDFFIPQCDLPEIVFRAKSLVELSVREGIIVQMSVGKIMCSGLRKLCLKLVQMDLEMFDRILERCPLIEELEVWYIEGFDNFKICKLNRLKELNVRLLENQKVVVEAPNVELLTCIDEENTYEVEDEVPMTTGISFPASQYHNLKSLLLSGVGINDNFFNDLARKFPNLEDLLVRHCRELESIKISSQSLKRIQLMDNSKLVNAQFDVPAINGLEYYGECNIIPQFVIAAAPSGWLSFICISWREVLDTLWFVKFKELLASLSGSEISLEIHFARNISFDVDEIRTTVEPHEHQEVQELSLHFDWKFSLEKGLSALDGLFWVCHPKTVNTHWTDNLENNKAMKFLYEMLMFRRIKDQSDDSQSTRFWQHDLKGVNVEVVDSFICLIGDTIIFTKKGKKEQQEEDLDWENFLNVLRNSSSKERMIYFKLKWRRRCMRREAKRMKTKNLKLGT